MTLWGPGEGETDNGSFAMQAGPTELGKTIRPAAASAPPKKPTVSDDEEEEDENPFSVYDVDEDDVIDGDEPRVGKVAAAASPEPSAIGTQAPAGGAPACGATSTISSGIIPATAPSTDASMGNRSPGRSTGVDAAPLEAATAPPQRQDQKAQEVEQQQQQQQHQQQEGHQLQQGIEQQQEVAGATDRAAATPSAPIGARSASPAASAGTTMVVDHPASERCMDGDGSISAVDGCNAGGMALEGTEERAEDDGMVTAPAVHGPAPPPTEPVEVLPEILVARATPASGAAITADEHPAFNSTPVRIVPAAALPETPTADQQQHNASPASRLSLGALPAPSPAPAAPATQEPAPTQAVAEAPAQVRHSAEQPAATAIARTAGAVLALPKPLSPRVKALQLQTAEVGPTVSPKRAAALNASKQQQQLPGLTRHPLHQQDRAQNAQLDGAAAPLRALTLSAALPLQPQLQGPTFPQAKGLVPLVAPAPSVPACIPAAPKPSQITARPALTQLPAPSAPHQAPPAPAAAQAPGSGATASCKVRAPAVQQQPSCAPRSAPSSAPQTLSAIGGAKAPGQLGALGSSRPRSGGGSGNGSCSRITLGLDSRSRLQRPSLLLAAGGAGALGPNNQAAHSAAPLHVQQRASPTKLGRPAAPAAPATVGGSAAAAAAAAAALAPPRAAQLPVRVLPPSPAKGVLACASAEPMDLDVRPGCSRQLPAQTDHVPQQLPQLTVFKPSNQHQATVPTPAAMHVPVALQQAPTVRPSGAEPAAPSATAAPAIVMHTMAAAAILGGASAVAAAHMSPALAPVRAPSAPALATERPAPAPKLPSFASPAPAAAQEQAEAKRQAVGGDPSTRARLCDTLERLQQMLLAARSLEDEVLELRAGAAVAANALTCLANPALARRINSLVALSADGLDSRAGGEGAGVVAGGAVPGAEAQAVEMDVDGAERGAAGVRADGQVVNGAPISEPATLLV